MPKPNIVSLDDSFETLPDDNESFDSEDIAAGREEKSADDSTEEDESLEDSLDGDEDEKKDEDDKSDEDQTKEDDPHQQGEDNTAADGQKASDKDDEGDQDASDKGDFHNHPRWIRRENLLKELRTKLADAEEKLANRGTDKADDKQDIQDVVLPPWFQAMMGNDEVAKQTYLDMRQEMTEQVMQSVYKDQIRESEAIQEVNRKVVNTIKENLEAINDEFGVNLLTEEASADRREFLLYMEELTPKDAEGRINLEALPNFVPAYRQWKKSKDESSKDDTKKGEGEGDKTPKPKTVIRKQVASLTKQQSSSGSSKDAAEPKKKVNISKMGWGDWRKAV